MCLLSKGNFSFLLFLIIASNLKAQTFFKSVYSPLGASIFWGAVKQNNDSAIILLAKAQKWLTIGKMDSVGNVLSTTKLKFETCQFYDHDFKAIITPDSSFVMTSSTFYEAFAANVFIAKLNKHAEPIWVKSIHGSSLRDVGSAIKYTTDGGYIVAGERWIGTLNPAAAYLVKMDSNAVVQWAKVFNRNRMDEFYDVEEVSGAFYSVGSSDSIDANGSYGLIIKTDKYGNTIWTKGLGSPLELIHTIVSDRDSLVVAGITRTHEPFLSKLDTNGNLMWTKLYHFDQYVYPSQMIKASDMGFIISGSYGKQHTSDEFGWFVLKTDANGNILWCKIYGGKASYYVSGNIQELADKSLLSFAKYEKNNFVFLVYKLDSIGNCAGLCELTNAPTASSITVLDSAIVFDDFYVTVKDSAIAYYIINDTLCAIDSCDIDWVKVNDINAASCQLFPNPVSGWVTIKLPVRNCEVSISDLMGHIVYRKGHIADEVQIDMSSFSNGVYFCTIVSTEKIWNHKFEVN